MNKIVLFFRNLPGLMFELILNAIDTLAAIGADSDVDYKQGYKIQAKNIAVLSPWVIDKIETKRDGFTHYCLYTFKGIESDITLEVPTAHEDQEAFFQLEEGWKVWFEFSETDLNKGPQLFIGNYLKVKKTERRKIL